MGGEFQDMITELIEGIQQDHFAELEEVLIDKALEAGHDFYFEDAELKVIAKAGYYNKHKFVADVLDCLRSRKVKNLVDAVQYVDFDTFTFSLVEPQEESSEDQPEQSLTESRSVVDIEAEIARLQQELVDAKIAEKKASYGKNTPTEVWYWDIYKDHSEKGTWISLDFDTVYETKDAAINGAYKHLGELDYEDELDYDLDDYYIDAVKIPISKVSMDALKWSGFEYLI